MLETLVVAAGLAFGLDLKVAGLLLGSLWLPWPTAAAVGVTSVMSWRQRQADVGARDIRFLELLVGELRSGASLRRALRCACAVLPGTARTIRQLDVGYPLPEAMAPAARALPTTGDLIVGAVEAGTAGGRLIPVFEELALHAVAEAQVEAEIRAATAQVKMSLVVLAGAPTAYLAWGIASGRLLRLLALPGGAVVGAGGAVLFLVGLIVMLLVARRRT